MKEPTTSFSIRVQQEVQINREFLLSQGWVLKNELPLYESFVHSKNSDLICAIGLYGDFDIAELHWCNKTPDKHFTTINPKLTKENYFQILDLLNIKLPDNETEISDSQGVTDSNS